MPDEKISTLNSITNANLAQTDQLVVADISGTETKKISVGELDSRYHHLVSVDFSIDRNNKNNVNDIHGGVNEVVNAGILDSVNPINTTVGISRVGVAVVAGSDLVGTIVVTGTTVDRDTGAETGADTELLTVTAISTNTSANDVMGNLVYGYSGLYTTTKWFKGAIVLSTTNLTLTDIDVMQLTFEQFEAHSNVTISSMDATFRITNTAAYYATYLYSIKKSNGTYAITKEAEILLPVGESEVGAYRMRRGNLEVALDGTTDGVFFDIFFKPDAQQYFESYVQKIWARLGPEDAGL